MREERGTEEDPAPGPPEAEAEGLVTVRGALGGLGLLWLAAMAGIGALGAAIHGVMTAPPYLAVAAAAAVLSVAAGLGSIRSFGLS